MNIALTKLKKRYRISLPVSYMQLEARIKLQDNMMRLYIRLLNPKRTFFFGRFTSSFIEAHLFKVLSRLKQTKKERQLRTKTDLKTCK